MTVIFSLIAGVFLGVLMHICGMFTYLIFQEVFESLKKKSYVGMSILIISIWFIFGFIGIVNLISDNYSLLISSTITFIALSVRYPWWRD
jgi:hypothetical protein